jgi:hypothetical protein
LLRHIPRIVKYGALVAAVVFTVPRLTTWLPFTLPFDHVEQDRCTFGPISNAEYREMLSKARSFQRWKWLGSNSAQELQGEFLQISGGSSSPYVKIAAIHAVLRALGAEFRNNGPFSFDRVSAKGGTVQFNYALPVPRIGVFSVWPGEAWFIGALKGPVSSFDQLTSAQVHQGQVHFVFHLPDPMDPIPDVLWRGTTSCPPVPSEELKGFYSG